MDEKIEPGSIVVAVDGSDHALRAVRWAAKQAIVEHRPLVAVTAYGLEEVRAIAWAGIEGAHAYTARQLHTGAHVAAHDAVDLARSLHPGVLSSAEAVLGDPRRVLIDLSHHAHLLVLGSRGRGTLRSILLGSVSAHVTKHAACPVVVCRPPDDDVRPGVVVGADATKESLPVLEFAFQQASLHGLPLTVVHCYWDVAAAVAGFREASGEVLNDPDLEGLRLAMAETLAGFAEKFPDVPVSLRLAHGLVDEALSPRGKSWDLIVVGRHPMTSSSRLVTGSIATAVLERSHSNVAVVPEAMATS